MKKIISLFTAVVLAFAFAVTASASVPTKLTFNRVNKSPTLDGTIDSIYGQPVFDIKATDLKAGDPNLAIATDDGSAKAGDATDELISKVSSVYNTMHSVGYAVFDDENLYFAFDVTDTYPKAASNSANYWEATNIQLVFYVNQQLCFPSIAYAGTNKINIFPDKRSEMDIDKIKVKFTENGGKYVYEVVIPWNSCPEVSSFKDVDDLRFGFIQTSMAERYVAAAFGCAYELDYSKLVPVELKDDGSVESGNQKDNQSTVSTAGNENTVSNNSSAAAPSGNGTQINTDNSDNTNPASSDNQTVTEEIIEGEKNYTPIIIIAVIGGLVIVGGVIAFIIINKKSADDNTENKNN